MNRSEIVYELVMGYNDLNQNRPPESRVVKSEFRPDSKCRELLDRIYLARVRLGVFDRNGRIVHFKLSKKILCLLAEHGFLLLTK